MVIFIRRLWNWCKRFRYRCGYGVHSPSDFFLITSVIYEELPYYAYAELEKREFSLNEPHYRKKANRLLFRLVNFFQPKLFVEVGKGNGEALEYAWAAHPSMKAVSLEEKDEKNLNKVLAGRSVIDFMHIAHTAHYQETFHAVLPYMGEHSCLVIAEPYASKEKEAWWKSLQQEEQVRITFDLYDMGLVFFDPKRYKQNYIVNFF